MKRAALAVLLSAAVSGCGLILQGTSQRLTLVTQPAGAQASFNGFDVTTPAVVTISRRGSDSRLYRATKEGYHPACKIVDCAPPRWMRVLETIPAALPLLFDVAVGSLGNCEQPSLILEPVRPNDVHFNLPRDEELMTVLEERHVDMCAHPYLYDPAFAQQAARILVTAGGVQRRYETLGATDFGQIGGDAFGWVTIPLGDKFTYTYAWHTFSQATPGEVNELLRRRALRLYGDRADAVINVAYQTNPRHDVFATGLAVRFVEPEPGQPGGAAERLEELQHLREKGLITDEEYQGHRNEVLRGLSR